MRLNAPNVSSYLHKHKMVSVCICVCVCVVVFCFSGDAFACAGKEGGRQGNRNTELIKSLRDRDGWPNAHSHTHTYTHSLENPPPPPAVSGCDVHRLPP